MATPVMAVALALGLLTSPAVLAQGPAEEDPRKQAEELAREATRKLLEALSIILNTIPQYALPEVNENGDIIIRRIWPESEPAPSEESAPEGDMDKT